MKKLIYFLLAFCTLCTILFIMFVYYHHDDDTTTLSTKVSNETVYDLTTQQSIYQEIQTLQTSNTYTEQNPLFIINPFGTNTTSLYVYFETEKAASVSYTIHVDDKTIRDYSNTLSSSYQQTHTYQIIGLIPNMENTVTLSFTYEDQSTSTHSFTIDGPSLKGKEPLTLEKTTGTSTQSVADGLYAILGSPFQDSPYMYYYDNDGILRGEIPIENYLSVRLLFNDTSMYVTVSKQKIAQINALGQVTNLYDLKDYELHHDFIWDNDGNFVVLATDTNDETVEDHIITINKDTGEIDHVIDLGDILPTYKETTSSKDDKDWDWMHINTLQWVDDDSLLLSSRETSTIIKIKDVYTNPTLEYMLADETIWSNTDYASYVYEKANEFFSQAGQHCITYVEDESLADGQYYLYMFNNNFGISLINSSIDWTLLDGIVTDIDQEDKSSYYYKYLVDETTQTYTLVDSFSIPFSSYVSSVQNLTNTTVINSGDGKVFQEYDAEHNLIQSFSLPGDKTNYRVFKYDFKGYYFN